MTEGFKPRLENALKSAGLDESSLAPEVRNDREIVERLVSGSPEAWKNIEALQDEKRALIDELREWRKKFWRADGIHGAERKDALSRIQSFEAGEAGRALRARPDGTFESIQKGGEATILTKGEVFAASEWGVWWKFDDSVSPETQMALMAHQVRRKVAGKYDAQLIAFGKADRASDDRKRDTYERIEQTQASLESMPDGILAEKMLMSFLTKQMHDGTLGFTVESVDVYEDVEHKIDFVITIADGTRRGVGVNEPRHRIGIQFTLDSGALERKRQQIDRVGKRIQETDVDELILVTMPIDDIRPMFEKWRYEADGTRVKEKRLDPRGPDRFWSDDVKRTILRGLVEHVSNHK